MKRIIALILIFTHLFSTVGFSMDVHQCGDNKEYSFYGINLGSSCSCDHEGEDHTDKCCKDKKTEVKSVKKECHVDKVFVEKSVIDFTLTQSYLFPIKKDIKLVETTNLFLLEHPPNNSPPLYILFGVFRI